MGTLWASGPIQAIVLENAHLLDEPPDTLIMRILQHINVWLSEYELIYAKKEKTPPVFAGPKGYPWPNGVDEHISHRASELRQVFRE